MTQHFQKLLNRVDAFDKQHPVLTIIIPLDEQHNWRNVDTCTTYKQRGCTGWLQSIDVFLLNVIAP